MGRSPVQWTADPHAGFTTGTPWMRVNDDYAEGWNVQAQLGDKASVHTFWATGRNRICLYQSHYSLYVYIRSPSLSADYG